MRKNISISFRSTGFQAVLHESALEKQSLQ